MFLRHYLIITLPKTTGRGVRVVSEPQQQPNTGPSNSQTIIFMVILSFVCALILSVLASVLAEPKEIAKDLDRSKQMMIAAKIRRIWLV